MIIYLIFGFVAFVFSVHVFHFLTLSRLIEYKEVSFRSTKITKNLNGCKIAIITDVHDVKEEKLREIVNKLNLLNIDLMVLGGDFSENPDIASSSIRILSETQTKSGIFGVDGNHDDHLNLFSAMKANGITPLSNNGLYARENLYVAGVEDYWNRKPNIEQAIAAAKHNDFKFLIAHNPDVTMVQDTTEIDLIVCGHTHGGQVTLFGVWAPHFTFAKNITKHGQRFLKGWCKSRNGTPVYVSNGVAAGTTGVPRVFARPQVVILTLLSA